MDIQVQKKIVKKRKPKEKENPDYRSDLVKWDALPNQSKEQIITWLYLREDLTKIFRKIAKTDYLTEELRSEIFLILCKQPETEILKMYEGRYIDFWILTTINQQFHSNTSEFYRKIKRYEIGLVITEERARAITIKQDTDTSTKHAYLDALEKSIDKLDWYPQTLFKLWLDLGTIKAVSDKVNIRAEYVSQVIRDAKEAIKKYVTDDIKKYLDKQIIE